METLQKKLKLKSVLERILSSAFPGTLVYHTSHKHGLACSGLSIVKLGVKKRESGRKNEGGLRPGRKGESL